MPRLPGTKAVPWMLVLQAALVARDHWAALDDRDRGELARIVRKSKGRPTNLNSHDRSELLRLVRLLDPLSAGRKLMPFPLGTRRGRR